LYSGYACQWRIAQSDGNTVVVPDPYKGERVEGEKPVGLDPHQGDEVGRSGGGEERAFGGFSMEGGAPLIRLRQLPLSPSHLEHLRGGLLRLAQVTGGEKHRQGLLEFERWLLRRMMGNGERGAGGTAGAEKQLSAGAANKGSLDHHAAAAVQTRSGAERSGAVGGAGGGGAAGRVGRERPERSPVQCGFIIDGPNVAYKHQNFAQGIHH